MLTFGFERDNFLVSKQESLAINFLCVIFSKFIAVYNHPHHYFQDIFTPRKTLC